MERDPRDAYEEAIIALGGPVLGTVGALACTGVATLGQMHLLPIDLSPNTQQLFFALGDWGYIINMFNLIPIGNLGKHSSQYLILILIV